MCYRRPTDLSLCDSQDQSPTNHFVSVNGEDVLKIGFEGFFAGGAMSRVELPCLFGYDLDKS